MVVQFLPLRRHGAEQGSARVDQVLPLQVHLAVHQEVLLLGPDVGHHVFDVRIAEQVQHPQRLAVQGFHAAQQGRLLVQRFPAVGAESRGDAQGLLFDKGIGGRVPGGIAAGLKGGAQAAGGEAGCVRLAGDELFAGKLHDDVAVGRGGNKAVVLFGRDSGQRLEPVRKVRRAVLDRPGAHRVRHGVCHGKIQLFAFVHGIAQAAVYIRGKPRTHDTVVKHHASEQFRYRTHRLFLLIVLCFLLLGIRIFIHLFEKRMRGRFASHHDLYYGGKGPIASIILSVPFLSYDFPIGKCMYPLS